MVQGKIKVFFTAKHPSGSGGKGFGYVSRSDGPDVWVHARQLASLVSDLGEDNLRGVEVEFELRQGARGPEAVNVNVAKQTTWSVSASTQEVFAGVGAPVVSWRTTVAGRTVEEKTQTVTSLWGIDTQWPEDIRAKAKSMVGGYTQAIEKAVAQIRWPEEFSGVAGKVTQSYDDGTLKGVMLVELKVTEQGIVRKARFTSENPHVFVEKTQGVVTDVIRVVNANGVSGVPAVKDMQTLEVLVASLGLPQTIEGCQFDEYGRAKGSLRWEGFGLAVDPSLLFEIPGVEISLGVVEDWGGYSLNLVLPSPWVGLTATVKGFKMEEEHLRFETYRVTAEGRIPLVVISDQRSAPIVVRAHLNETGSRFTPATIKEELRSRLSFRSLAEWQARWRMLVTVWDGKLLEHQSGYPEMARLNERMDQVSSLLTFTPEFVLEEGKRGVYEAESLDGWRGASSYTETYSIPGYQWPGAGGIRHFRAFQREEGQTLHEIRLDLLKLEAADLAELRAQLVGWLAVEACYEGETESGWYDDSIGIVDLQGLVSLERANSQKAEALFAEIDGLTLSVQMFPQKLEEVLAVELGRYQILQAWHNQVCELVYQNFASVSEGLRAYESQWHFKDFWPWLYLEPKSLSLAKWAPDPWRATPVLDEIQARLEVATGLTLESWISSNGK